jgi:peptidylamidoglycolate lyase
MVVPDWPSADVKMGQISAVCFDQEGNVVVFHRGNHVWNMQSFLPNEVYNQKELGAIAVKTVVVFDAMSGKVVRDWGADL